MLGVDLTGPLLLCLFQVHACKHACTLDVVWYIGDFPIPGLHVAGLVVYKYQECIRSIVSEGIIYTLRK